MFQEKKAEGDLPALKTVLTHQYIDLWAIYKSVGEDSLQKPEALLTTRKPTKRQ